jgi:hypothetical protein
MTLRDEERAEAVGMLRRSYEEFERLTAGLDNAGWARKPAPEQWSVLEIAEHLLFIEAGVPRMVLPKLLRTEAVEIDWEAERLKEAALWEAVAFGGKAEAPPPTRPVGACADGPEACRKLGELRAAMIGYVETTRDALRAHRLAHPLFGPLDGYQWVMMLGAHHLRHNRQVERTIASSFRQAFQHGR